MCLDDVDGRGKESLSLLPQAGSLPLLVDPRSWNSRQHWVGGGPPGPPGGGRGKPGGLCFGDGLLLASPPSLSST